MCRFNVAIFVVAFSAMFLSCSNPSGPDPNSMIQFVEDQGNYLIFNDTQNGLVEQGVVEGNSNTSFFDAIAAGFLQAHPDDTPYILFLVDFPDAGCCTYRPMANETLGIGLAHRGAEQPIDFDPNEAIFDRTPGSKIDGIASLGFWEPLFFPNSEAINERLLSLVVGHELAHAWLAFPWYLGDGLVQTDLLGVESAHWNFYLSTENSPMEGLDWADTGNGIFTAQAKINSSFQYGFNHLELYLMGLLAPEEVEPVFVIDNPSDCMIDGQNKPCPSEDTRSFGWGSTISLRGTRREITVEDVMAIEGERSPDFAQVTGDIEVSFVLIKRPQEDLSAVEKERVGRLVDRAIEQWSELTGGKGRLTNRSGIN